jgi:hypothetical protein
MVSSTISAYAARLYVDPTSYSISAYYTGYLSSLNSYLGTTYSFSYGAGFIQSYYANINCLTESLSPIVIAYFTEPTLTQPVDVTASTTYNSYTDTAISIPVALTSYSYTFFPISSWCNLKRYITSSTIPDQTYNLTGGVVTY